MANFIKFLYRLVMLYMYYVLGACMLSWVPNINPDYPLFNFIFKLYFSFSCVRPSVHSAHFDQIGASGAGHSAILS